MNKVIFCFYVVCATVLQFSEVYGASLIETLGNRSINGNPHGGGIVQDGGGYSPQPCSYCTDSSFNWMGISVSGNNDAGFFVSVNASGSRLSGWGKYGPFFLNFGNGSIEVSNPWNYELPRVAVGRFSETEFQFADPSKQMRSGQPNFSINAKLDGSNLTVYFSNVREARNPVTGDYYGKTIYFQASGTLEEAL